MSIDEPARLELFERLREVLGVGPADTLIGHLPPGGWGDVARKDDLIALERRIDARFDAFEATVDTKLARFRGDLLRTMLTAWIVTYVTTVGVILGVTYAG